MMKKPKSPSKIKALFEKEPLTLATAKHLMIPVNSVTSRKLFDFRS